MEEQHHNPPCWLTSRLIRDLCNSLFLALRGTLAAGVEIMSSGLPSTKPRKVQIQWNLQDFSTRPKQCQGTLLCTYFCSSSPAI